MPETKTRDSNFELLRIFAMFIIILHHFAQHGIFFPPESASQFSFNFFVKEILWGTPGAIGNWLFIFISGFFISEKSASKEKIFRLWFQIFSTSVIIGLVFYFAKIPTIGSTHT
ncbi:MAG: acyltransferase family protein, partial [Treponemataceae bacterium]|nr:acyltransferase family protein [Treponemataceae bacterium]